MKRNLFSLFLAVCGLLVLASFASAEVYTVKKGDVLSRIGQHLQVDWRELARSNHISNPNHIVPGQKLIIPDRKGKKPAKRASAAGKSGEFIYVQPDGDPVGAETDPTPYINAMKVPAAVKEQFLIWALGPKPTETAVITRQGNPAAPADKKVFSRLDAMGFGKDGRLKENVKVVFSALRQAWYWSMEYEGIIYNLVLDQSCYNWAFVIEAPMAAPVAKTPKIAAIPAPKKSSVPALLEAVRKPAPIQEAVVSKPAEPALATAPEVTVTSAPPAELPPSVVAPAEPVAKKAPVSKKSRHQFDPDTEIWLYGGLSKGIQRNHEDHGSYWGISASFFPDKWELGDGYLRVGPAFQYVGWEGLSGNVDYDGHFELFGAEAQYLTANTKTNLKALWGEKNGYVYGRGFPYYAHETADLLAIEGAYQWWNNVEAWQREVGFRAEIASNNNKHSSIDGRPLSRHEDPIGDQSVYTIRAKQTWTKNPNVMPTVEVNGGWRASGKSYFGQVRPGVKLWKEIIEPSVHYQWEEGPQNDSVGVNVNINLSKLVKEFLND